jgi:uridine phosphorylase
MATKTLGESGPPFVPHHIDASIDDLSGNGGIGRYVLLPGSDGRAREIAGHFEGVRERPHPRGHNLYLGQIRIPDNRTTEGRAIDVASVSTGMGCPSVDIIVNELYRLGARRFLRVGTAGSLQPQWIRAGSLVVATASVRDEHTSRAYVPVEFPAVASSEMIAAARRATTALGLDADTWFGIVHCKDSLFARELHEGPMAIENDEYMALLRRSGVLASEMETSQLFVLGALFDHRLRAQGNSGRVMAGAILGVVGDDRPFAPPELEVKAVADAVALALETVRQLAAHEPAAAAAGP